jgi:flagellar protein FliS
MVSNKTDPAAAYRRNNILTANPMELVVMLFDGVIKDLSQAKLAIETEKIEIAHKKLINAQDIIAELMLSLNPKMAISETIMPVYEFILQELEAINTSKDALKILPLQELVSDWRGIWQDVAISVKTSGTSSLQSEVIADLTMPQRTQSVRPSSPAPLFAGARG